ncbi:unnamed protein product [Orchesella dallaii]|uniref:RNA-directed DNA polymerase n=1 Tax=Orchesella dallaii TaxID=48710 RepID=A0ABP1QJV8_9HEXA
MPSDEEVSSEGDESTKTKTESVSSVFAATAGTLKTEVKKPKQKVIVKTMGTIGSISPFDQAKDNIEDWLIIFDSFLTANDLDPDCDRKNKCRSILLSSIGATSVCLLKNMFSPRKLDEVSLDEMLSALERYHKPPPKALAERFKFAQRKQQPGETVSQYLAELRKLAQDCKFTEEALQERLRDQLILGPASEKAQCHIFTLDDDIALDEVVRVATARETAQARTAVLRGNSSAVQEGEIKKMNKQRSKPKNKGLGETDKQLNQTPPKLQQKSSGSNSSNNSGQACTRCGKQGHNQRDCPHIDAECYGCGGKGHFSSMCKSKKKKEVKTISAKSNSEIRTAVHQNKKLITVEVKISGKSHLMELDTGCDTSILSKEFWQKELGAPKLKSSNVVFRTYTKETFRPVGELDTQIEYKGQTVTTRIQVGKGNSLFGKDLLKLIKVDWNDVQKQCNLVQSENVKNEELEKLLNEYEDIFRVPSSTDRIRGFKARIILKDEASPKFLKARPLPFAVRQKVEQELVEMEKTGVITKIDHSDWASPLVVVPKQNGKVRITGDFKHTVNNQLCVTQYPLAVPEDLFTNLTDGEKFSKLDGANAYHQVEIEEECKKFLVINTHKGLFQYNVLPQGIASSPAIFQEFMDRILQGIHKTGSYIDDAITTAKTDSKHIKILRQIFDRMRKFNYRLSRDKCELMRDQLEFLGHKISKQGIKPTEAKVETIQNIAVPHDVTSMKSFLGLINFYGKFVHELAELCEPLYALTKKDVEWKWSTQHQKAFDEVKRRLASAPLLVHFTPNQPIGISADASSVALGVVLFHKDENGHEKPIAYASKVLSQTEKRYSQIEKEGLAIIFGIKKFYKYLCGRQFLLVTDHKPLLTIFGPKSQLPTYVATRLHHWSLYLSQFQYDVIYRKSADHGNADALSRVPINEVRMTTANRSGRSQSKKHDDDDEHTSTLENGVEAIIHALAEEQTGVLPVTAAKIRKATRCDSVLSKVLQYNEVGWPSEIDKDQAELSSYFTRKDEISVIQDIVMWGVRVIIPKVLRKQMLEQLHEAHFGIVRMKNIARQHIYWPNIDKDVEEIAKKCTQCMEQKPNPQSAPLHPWVYPEKPWQRIHMDLAGPFHNKMWLLIVDAHSKWPKIFCMNENTSTAAVVDKLKEVFARFGLPMQIVTDNGRQFTSEEFEQFCKLNGIKHLCSSVYHPRSNGEAERLVRTFKEGMRGESKNLNHRLQTFLLHYRASSNATTGCSPSELLQGRKLRMRIDLVKPDIQTSVADAQAKQEATYNKKVKMGRFHPDQEVWVQTFSRNEQKWTRGKVIHAVGPVSYMIQVGDKKIKRHVDQMSDAIPDMQMTMAPDPVATADVPSPSSVELAEPPRTGVQLPTDSSRPRRTRKPVIRLDL